MQALLPECVSHRVVARGLDPAISNKTLRSIFVHLRHIHEVFLFATTNPKFEEDAIGHYIRTAVIHGMARAHNYYLISVTASASHQYDKLLPESSRLGKCVELILCLALQYWARIVSMTDDVVVGEKKHVFNAGAGLLSRLKNACHEYDTITSSSEKLIYERPVLWALYVGAWSDHLHAHGQNHIHAEEQWFNVRLAAHVDRMSLHSWSEVRRILVGYIHNDHLSSDGSLWFRR